MTPLATPLSIAAAGMTCSLGLRSDEACASARAGVVRVSQVTTLNTEIDPAFAKETIDGVPPFVAHVAPIVGSGFSGVGKLLAMAQPALEFLIRKAALDQASLAQTGLCVCVPESFYLNRYGLPVEPLGPEPLPDAQKQRRHLHAQIANRLCDSLQLPIPAKARWVSGSGRLGLLGALQQASNWIASGEVKRCIVGGIDSLIEPSVLQACAQAGVLKTDANPVGFMPGEAAAFVLLEPATGHTDVLQIMSMGHALDAAYLDPEQQPLGRGITQVVQQAMAGSTQHQAQREAMAGLLITDLNGTEPRANDWGHALVRLREELGEFDAQLWLPVDSFGETGSACGSVALCMAFEAARRKRLPASTALLVLCADDGGRGALLLQAPQIRH